MDDTLTINIVSDASRLLSSIGLANTALAGLGLGVASLGVQSVTMAGNFQSSLTTLVTGAGESANNLKMVSDGVLKTSVDTGTATKQLTDGLYMIESSGQHGAQALQTLTDAAEGAKVGNASLADVANGVTTEMTDYASSGLTAAQATNTLIATVADGKTHMADLASAMSTILPTSSAVGVSLTDTAGAMATMTSEGTDAASAATYLRQLLMALENPAKKGADALASVGLSTADVAAEMKVSLPGALQLITDHLKTKFPEGSAAYNAALSDIAGGTRQMQGLLELTGSHLQTFEGDVNSISDAVKKGGNSITGWNLVQQDFNFKLAQAQEAVSTLGIKLGTLLLPVLGSLLSFLTPVVSSLSNLGSVGSALSPIFSNIGGMVRIMAANWADLSTNLRPVGNALSGFGQLLGQLLPGFISQGLRALNDFNSILIISAQFIGTIAVPGIALLGQIFKSTQQAVEPVLNAIEARLIPAIASLWGAIAPLVAGFLQWIATSNIIPTIFGVISFVVTNLVTGLAGLITGIANVTNFFRQNHDAATLLLIPLGILGGYFVFLGVSAISSFIAAAPAMITGFLAGASAAWTMAAGVLAATWPFLLIGAVVGAVVAGIVIAITHWSSIVAFFRGIWAGFTSWFMGAVRSVGAFFTGVWHGIASFFTGLWNGLLAGLRAVWAVITTVVQTALAVLVAIITAPFRAIGALFEWLYQHNYYFQALVDTITSIVSNFVNWLVTAWTNVSNWLVGAWNNIVGFATNLWNTIAGAIQTGFNAAIGFVVGIWTTISGVFSSAWNNYIVAPLAGLWSNVSSFFGNVWTNYIATPISNLWTSFTSAISGAWGAVSGALSSLWTNITNTVSGWISSAVQWGSNLIQGFINGITSMFSSIGNTLSNVASNIASFLGFHSPTKEGAGREADKWMPNLVNMLSSGLEAGAPKIAASVNQLIAPLAVIGALPASAPALQGGNQAAVIMAAMQAQQQNATITIPVTIDGKEVGRATSKWQQDEVRRRGGVRR